MAQKQSLSDINAKIEAIKQFVDSLAGSVFGYEILAVDTNFNKEMSRYRAHYLNLRPEERTSICDRFKDEIDGLTAIPTTAIIHVIITGKKKNDIKLDEQITLLEAYNSFSIAKHDEQTQQQPQQQNITTQPQIPNAQADAFKQISNVLTLMGFGGLAGADDGTAGLNQVLTVRDGLIEQRHANEKKDEKITQLTTNLALAEQERDRLKNEIEKYERRIERANEHIENLEIELEEKNEQIRKLHPEFSLMGTSLTALLGAGIKNFAMAHANTIGGLMGVDGDALRVMLSKDEQTLPTADESNNDDDNSDGRAEQYKMIREFIKTLSDKEFDDYWQLMRVFAANKETIAIVLAIAKGNSNNAQEQSNNVEQQ